MQGSDDDTTGSFNFGTPSPIPLEPVDPLFLDKFEAAAYKSIADESAKFGEAVVTVMTQRVEQF